MTRAALTEQIRLKKNYLCVGLDTDSLKLPAFLKHFPDPVFEFNKQIIDATRDHCVAYKINTAFYEVNGAAGWETLQKTADYIPSSHFKIADAKRAANGGLAVVGRVRKPRPRPPVAVIGVDVRWSVIR